MAPVPTFMLRPLPLYSCSHRKDPVGSQQRTVVHCFPLVLLRSVEVLPRGGLEQGSKTRASCQGISLQWVQTMEQFMSQGVIKNENKTKN